MRISQGADLRGGLIGRGLGIVLLGLLLAGCGRNETQPPHTEEMDSRVICGSPAVAEIVFSLGCGDQVVGVSAYTVWPPDAAAKPVIGGALSPNRERILALEPTLILTQGKAESLGGFARSHEIDFLSFPLDTLDELRAAITGFASALGAEEQGAVLLAEMKSGFAVLPSGESVSVFIAIGHAPGDLSALMTTGPGTFLDELVTRAGGSNVFSDVKIDWPKISQESLIRRAPKILLDFQSFPVEGSCRAALLNDWEHLGFQAEQVCLLDEAIFLRPGPRAVQSVSLINEALGGN